MKRIIQLVLLGVFGSGVAYGQYQALNGFCTAGGQSAMTQGLPSANKQQQIVPSCQVKVYLSGTTTLASIFSTAGGGVLANPFTASALGSAAPGQWLFYAAAGTAVDVVMSGGNPPLTFATPVTLTGLVPPGGGSSGSGNVLTAPHAQVAGYTQAGTVATVGASSVAGPLVNFGTPLFEGAAYADQFNTGNNGIINALNAGATNVVVPPGYIGTDQIYNTIAPSGTSMTDLRNGFLYHAFTNVGTPLLTQCINGPVINLSSECEIRYDYDSTNSPYTTGLWASHVNLELREVKTNSDINQVVDIDHECVAQGDCGTFYMYTTNSSRASAGGDEGNLTMSMEQITPPPLVGTVSTGGGGPGTELIQTNMLFTAGAGRDLVSTSELIASGNIVSLTTPGGIAPNLINTSDTHTASTAIGTLNGACGTNVVRTAPVTTVCPIVTTSGAFTATPSVGTFAKVCIADYQHPEEVDITAASPTSLTMKLTFSHQSGMSIFQGSCGGALVLGNGYTNPFTGLANQVTTYFVSGAPTTTSWAYVVAFNEGQNGNVPLKIPYNFSDTITNATRTGTSIAIQVAQPAVNFNSYAIPSGAQICITGSSNSNLNVCNITATTTAVQGFTVNGTSAGTAGSGTGGTLFVSGLNNYFIYAMATVTVVNGVNINTSNGSGQFGLSPNTGTWANNAPLLLANAYNQSFSNMRISSIATVPPNLPIVGSNIQVERDAGGAAWSSGILNCYFCGSNDPPSSHEGYGGTLVSPVMNYSPDGLFHGYFSMVAPVPSGSGAFGTPSGFVFQLVPPPVGGTGISTFYFLETYSDAGGIGESDEIIDRNSGLWTWNGQGGLDVVNLANAGGMQSFSFNTQAGILISDDPDLGSTWTCIRFNGALPPLSDRRCHNLSIQGIEADQSGADQFLHIKTPYHTGGFKFDILNAGGTAFDTPIEITENGIIDAALSNGCATWASGVLGSTGAACGSGGGGGTVTSAAVSGANGIGVSGSPITGAGTIALSLGAITPTSVTSETVNQVQYAAGAPSSCTTGEGSFTHNGDCAFFQAYDLAVSTGNSVDLYFGNNYYLSCAEWTQPTSGFINVNLIGSSLYGTHILNVCSNPTVPMMTKTAGSAYIVIKNLTMDGAGTRSSCFDGLAGIVNGLIENVACQGIEPTATSGSDHMMQLGSTGSYAEDLTVTNLWFNPPYSIQQTYASLTGVLSGTAIASITINSGGNYGASSTYAVGIVNDPNNYCSSKPTFTVTINGGGAVSGTTVTAGGHCTALPDFIVINQQAITYGLKGYMSDGLFEYLQPNNGITGAIIYGSNNTIVEAHPTAIQYGIQNEGSNHYVGYHPDTIASAALKLNASSGGGAGTSVEGTTPFFPQPGSVLYYFLTNSATTSFGPQSNLCPVLVPVDYHEFGNSSGTLVPGGSGWPTNSSIYGNDQSCTTMGAGSNIDYAANIFIGQSSQINLPGGGFAGDSQINSYFTTGTSINLSVAGDSFLGFSGTSGVAPAYVLNSAQYFTDTTAGDIAFRATSSGHCLDFGTDGSSASDLKDCNSGITITKPVAINASGTPSQAAMTYNSVAPTVGSSTTAVYAVSASGQAETSEAGAAFSRICTAANGVCSTSGTATIVASAEVVSFSATPTFSTAFNVSRIVLTGNITSFTLGAGADGQDKKLCFKQGSGSYTVAPPTNVHGGFFSSIASTASGTWSCQTWTYDLTDSIWLATGPGVIGQ